MSNMGFVRVLDQRLWMHLPSLIRSIQLSVMFVLQEALSFGGGGILIEQRQVR
jgi:hypothetical protein